MGDILINQRNHPKRRNHLFCIGINDYAHVNKLSNAVLDVEAFAELVVEDYHFQREYIQFLTDQEATRTAIIDKLKGYASSLTENDNLILYFSGHGMKDKLTEEGFWIPVEGEKGNESSWLANETVMRYIRSMNAHHIFLLIDACFSGSFFVQARSLESQYDFSPSRFAITSGAEEIVSDGPSGQNSPFAQTVLRFLKTNQEPVVGVGSLFEEVKKYIPSNQKPQARHLEIRGRLFDGEFCFYRRERVVEEGLIKMAPRNDRLFEVKDIPKVKEEISREKLRHPILEKLGLEMVKVDGGSYRMGGTEHWIMGAYRMIDKDPFLISSTPAHEVKVEDFYIGKYPITQEQWIKVMGSNPATFKGDLQRPMEMVSWGDCHNFLKRLYELTELNFRLPTEAEWEYAARGGSMSKGYTYAGSKKLGEVGWYRKNSGKSTQPVGQKKSNELGIFDMSGNVREWCLDDDHENYEGAPSDGSAWIKKERGSFRISRGGSWYFAFPACQIVYRFKDLVNNRYDDIGFRIAISS